MIIIITLIIIIVTIIINRSCETGRNIYKERDIKIRLSVTPVHRTVQGLSMVSCREGITKSKHFFSGNLLLQIFALEGFVKARLA